MHWSTNHSRALAQIFAIGLGWCAWGCGSDCPSDCESPFVCTGEGEAAACRTLASPCRDSPPDSFLPLQDSLTGSRLHWVVGRCAPVTLENALADHLELVRGAVAELNGVSCSSLCFEEPSLSDEPLDASARERRVHFVLEPDLEYPAQANSFWERSSGIVYQGEIAINPAVTLDGEPLDHGDVLSLMMSTMGFEKVDSLGTVHHVYVDRRSVDVLTTSDRDSICSVYGSEPWCSSSLVAE